MAWWIWVLGGLVLLLAEVLTPGGFFIVFFGAGAILVGVLKGLGWNGPAWAEWLRLSGLLDRAHLGSGSARARAALPGRERRGTDDLAAGRVRPRGIS